MQYITVMFDCQVSSPSNAVPAFSSTSTVELQSLLDSQKIWHAQALAREACMGIPTGFPDLDRVLPYKGWPKAQLIELLDSDSANSVVGNSGICSLLMPAICQQLAHKEQLVLINPGFEPNLPAWFQSVDRCSQVLRVDVDISRGRAQARACWAMEQALHCADIAMVIAWLPLANVDSLRRLQVAASKSQALVFVIRNSQASQQGSAAPLRLSLERIDPLNSCLRLLKCRGATSDVAINIPILSPELRALLQAPRRRSYQSSVSTIKKQQPPTVRLTPRSQQILIPMRTPLYGNERAADVPEHRELHHGLDRPPPSRPLPITTTTHEFSPYSHEREMPDRSQRRAARRERSH